MAHQTEIVINGVTTAVTEFDHTAQEIDDGIDNLHNLTGGATTPQGALANLGAGVRPNLLDNAIFIDGGSQQGGGQLPVNQRGQTSYTAEGYTVDRWRMVGSAAKITVQGDGIYYEKTADATSYGIWQEKFPLGNLEGKELTVSVLVDDVCYSDTIAAGWTYSNGTTLKYFYINNGSKQMMISVICDADNILIFRFYYGGSVAAATTGFLLQAAKLEEGSTQTLAYQDEDGTWQRLPQPESDYVTQLAKCQRYYWDSGVESYGGCSGIASGKRVLSCNVQFPITMRAVPSIKIYNGNSENEIRNSNTNAKVPLGTTGKYANQSGLSFLYNGSEDVFEDGAAYDFRVIANAEL